MINIDFAEIGSRIQKERNELGLSQEELSSKINVSRQTLSKWEKGNSKSSPDVLSLLLLCNVFDCDFGYLVGEYSCKKRVTSDIHDETGLSELAVLNIQAAAINQQGPLNHILEDTTNENIHLLEVGRKAKIPFLIALLENESIWEEIAACAYEYSKYKKVGDSEGGVSIRRDKSPIMFSYVEREAAKDALVKLMDLIKWEV